MMRMKYLNSFLWHNQLFDCFRRLNGVFFLFIRIIFILCLISFEKLYAKYESHLWIKNSKKRRNKYVIVVAADDDDV